MSQEELEVPYEVKRYTIPPGSLRAPQSLKVVHPLGKSPMITDGDVTLAESGAIVGQCRNNRVNFRRGLTHRSLA